MRQLKGTLLQDYIGHVCDWAIFFKRLESFSNAKALFQMIAKVQSGALVQSRREVTIFNLITTGNNTNNFPFPVLWSGFYSAGTITLCLIYKYTACFPMCCIYSYTKTLAK